MTEQGSYYSMKNLSHTGLTKPSADSVGEEDVPTSTPAVLGPTYHMGCLVQDNIRLLQR